MSAIPAEPSAPTDGVSNAKVASPTPAAVAAPMLPPAPPIPTPPPFVPVEEPPVVHSDVLSDDDIMAQFGMPPDDEFIEPNRPPVMRSAPAPMRPTFTKPIQPVAQASAQPVQQPARAAPVSSASAAASSAPTNTIAETAVSMADLPPAFELWQRVLAEITDMLKSHAKAVTRAAYPGSGRLEIVFPNRFAFSRKYCEKVESVRRLEDIAARLTGRTLKINVTSCADSPEDIPKTLKSEAQKPARVYRPEDDAYVVKVMNTFSAQVVKIDPILISNSNSEEN